MQPDNYEMAERCVSCARCSRAGNRAPRSFCLQNITHHRSKDSSKHDVQELVKGCGAERRRSGWAGLSGACACGRAGRRRLAEKMLVRNESKQSRRLLRAFADFERLAPPTPGYDQARPAPLRSALGMRHAETACTVAWWCAQDAFYGVITLLHCISEGRADELEEEDDLDASLDVSLSERASTSRRGATDRLRGVRVT